MKIQDIAFLSVAVVLFFSRNPRYFVIAGLVCLVVAMPLFAFWIFFTAERLTWYAATFFFSSIFFYLRDLREVQ